MVLIIRKRVNFMRKQRWVVQLLLLVILLSCYPVWAAGNLWLINSENSSVSFKIQKTLLIPVKGEFTNFSGTVSYDGRNLRDATVSAEIVVNSVDTGIPKRDLRLKSNDFFDVVHYPVISFKSRKIVTEESGAFKIIGLLSMHGVMKPVTLTAQPLKAGNDGSGKEKLTTIATTTLNRKDFGISLGWVDQAGTVLSDKVKVILNIELVQSG
jgi:polyisoprenoid-binding protein YceI